jgi:hypothetical protein
MTLRLLLATLLQLSICWAQDKLVEWETPSALFTLVEQKDHSDQIVFDNYYEIVSDYHWRQFQSQPEKQRPMSDDAYQKIIRDYHSKISERFHSGELSLLLIYGNAKIVAGTSYVLEEKQQTIKVCSTGLTSDLKHMDKSIIIQTLVRVLSDPTKFPHAKRLVVVFRPYNQDGHVLKRLGFVDSSYRDPDLKMEDYITLEKPISTKRT